MITQKTSIHYSKKEENFLLENYPQIGLRATAVALGRTVGGVKSKVSSMGIKQDRNSKFFKDWQSRAGKTKIGKKRPVHSKIMKGKADRGELAHQQQEYYTPERRKMLSDRMKKQIKCNGHYKGMLGKTHSDKNKKIFSEKSKKMWLDKGNYLNSKEYRQLLSDRMSKNMNERIKNKGSIYSRSKNGWYKISGKEYYFRSSWEVVYARYLEFLKDKEEIIDWEYEVDTFWFKKIKRGVRSYNPDFKVFFKKEVIEYHEVKGYMDSKSKTKIKRMAKYFPETTLIVIDKDIYKDIVKYEKLYPEAKFLRRNNNKAKKDDYFNVTISKI